MKQKLTILLIIALLTMMLTVAVHISPVMAGTFTFGRSDTGTATGGIDANYKITSKFTCPNNGQMTKISVYTAGSTAGNMRCAVYADSAGEPGALIAQTNAAAIGTGFAWVDCAFATPPSVTANTAYWLASLCDVNRKDPGGYRVGMSVSNFRYNNDAYSDGFSNPFGSGTSVTYELCIYATCTTGGVDRTAKYGIVIQARTYDDLGITPQQIKASLDQSASTGGIVFKALRIEYSYLPPADSPQTIVNKIHTWVDYFDDYYSTIYLSCPSVGRINRTLTDAEIDGLYSPLANLVYGHPAVKVFMGEMEPEGKQWCERCGEEWGNGVAYHHSYQEMMDYIAKLHTKWHTYISTPFSFASITPVGDNGNTVWNDDCWFFGSCPSATYWNWIRTQNDKKAIDEWHYHDGVGIWKQKLDQWNADVYIGETFSAYRRPTDTEALLDSLGNHLTYFFWWSIVHVQPGKMNCPETTRPYLYWPHCGSDETWPQLQKKAYGTVYGNYMCNVETWSYGDGDFATAETGASIPINPGGGSSQRWEYYNTNDDSYLEVFDFVVPAQTFTTGWGGDRNAIKLKLYKYGNPPSGNTLRVSIRDTDAYGHPTGGDLTYGTIDPTTLTTDTNGAWYSIPITSYYLFLNHKYAIVLKLTGGNNYNEVRWRVDATSPTYSGGNEEESYDSGGTWQTHLEWDCMFELWYISGVANHKFGTTFAIDMFRTPDYESFQEITGGYEATLMAFLDSAGTRYYALTTILADYNGDGYPETYLKLHYPYGASGGMKYWTWTTPFYFDIWYKATIYTNGAYIELSIIRYLPDGSYFFQIIYSASDNYQGQWTATKVSFGANGGNMVKLDVGEIKVLTNDAVVWSEDWEDGNMAGWVCNYHQPSYPIPISYIMVDDAWRYDVGTHWILNEIKS